MDLYSQRLITLWLPGDTCTSRCWCWTTWWQPEHQPCRSSSSHCSACAAACFVIPCTDHLQPFHFSWSADFVTSLHFLRLSPHLHVLFEPLLFRLLVPDCSCCFWSITLPAGWLCSFCWLQTPFTRSMALPHLWPHACALLARHLRSNRCHCFRHQELCCSRLTPWSPQTLTFSLVTHGSGLRAPNSHLLCCVMLLDKRFARPRADLHHRPKSNWSCVRRQSHDSRDRLPWQHFLFPLGLPDVRPTKCWVIQGLLCLAARQLLMSLIDRSAKLVEPSLSLDSPCITAILAHTPSGWCLQHLQIQCCAHATSYSCLWRAKLHSKTASGRPVLASCIWSFSTRTSILALNSWPATSFLVEDQPRTWLYHSWLLQHREVVCTQPFC